VESKFSKGTDTEHSVKLESHLISAEWRTNTAYTGYSAAFEVRTSLVGNGAAVKLTGKSESGKKLGKIRGEIRNNIFLGEFDIPERLETGDHVFFEVKLSKNGLDGTSNRIIVRPGPQVSNMSWSADQARRGDRLTLSADVDRVENGTEATVVIYEYDHDSAHDKIAELPTEIRDGRMEVVWEYEYHEDTDELPTQEELEEYGSSYNPPEYFFTIKIGELEFGTDQESGLLTFKDFLVIELVDSRGNVVGNQDYEVTLPDGSTREGTLDDQGRARLEDIPPGRCRVTYPGRVPEHEEEQTLPDDIDREGAAAEELTDEEREAEQVLLDEPAEEDSDDDRAA